MYSNKIIKKKKTTCDLRVDFSRILCFDLNDSGASVI